MQSPNQSDNPWSWWQPLRLRMEIRKHMRPITPDKAHRFKLIASIFYFSSAFFIFHILNLRAGIAEHKFSAQEVALEHLNSGKIVKMDNLKIKKIVDYRSQDFDSEIKRTNKPSRILHES